jgi:hypothetical protein
MPVMSGMDVALGSRRGVRCDDCCVGEGRRGVGDGCGQHEQLLRQRCAGAKLSPRQKTAADLEYPIGILTYGLGDVSGRNLESLLAEFEQTISTYAEAGSYTVREIAEQLHGFIRGEYDAAFPPPSVLPLTVEPLSGDGQPGTVPSHREPVEEGQPATAPDLRPPLGVVIGGYSRREFFPDEFEFLLPSGVPSEIWPGARLHIPFKDQDYQVDPLPPDAVYYLRRAAPRASIRFWPSGRSRLQLVT